MADLILVDALPSYRRVVLLRDGVIDQIWIDDDSNPMPQPGAVLAARVAQIFPHHDRVHVDVHLDHQGKAVSLPASARFSGRQAAPLKSGQMLAVTVSALPREDKPLQVKIKGDVSPKDVPPAPCLMAAAPDGLAQAQSLAPQAKVVVDDDGSQWDQYNGDQQIDQACQPVLALPNGAVLHVNTPPGAAVIDVDSGASGLPPYDLGRMAIPIIMQQIRLRRIGGPLVIDLPRLNPNQQKDLHQLIKTEAKSDPEKPSLHGFTRGGLYTLARPWRGQMLAEVMASDAASKGRAALRLIRRHRALNTQGGMVIRIADPGLAWLTNEGAGALRALTADLAFSPEFRSDNSVTDAVMD